jgi:hypothetical protein
MTANQLRPLTFLLLLQSCALPNVAVRESAVDSGMRIEGNRSSDAGAADSGERSAVDSGTTIEGNRSGDAGAVDGGERPKMNTPVVEAGKGGSGAEPAADASGAPAETTPVCDVKAEDRLTIWVVVDGSGSMLEPYGSTTRWTALRVALLDPQAGLIATTSRRASWGVVFYDGPTPVVSGGVDAGMFSAPPATECPRIVVHEPRPDNFERLSREYPYTPLGGSTPTHKAIDSVVRSIKASPQDPGRKVIILATDGVVNDYCSTDGGIFGLPDLTPELTAAVNRLLDVGGATFVLSLAGQDAALSMQLRQVANASGTSLQLPMNEAMLRQALARIFDSLDAPCGPP